MLNRKAILWKPWRTSSKAEDKQAYKNYAVKCRNTFLAHQRDKELALINKNITGSFFRYVNNKISTFKDITVIKDVANDKLIYDRTEQAYVFNKHFTSIFTTDDGQLPKIDSNTDKLTFLNTIDFSVYNVHKILLSLKSK